MKIGIELRQVNFGSSGGLAQLLHGALQAAFARYPQHQFVVFCTIFSRSLVCDNRSNVTVHTVPGFRFFERIDEAAATGEIEVLFRSYPMEAPLKMPWDKQLVMIPDLQHELFPEFFPTAKLVERKLVFNQAMARAKAIVAISGYARQTILKHEWNRCRDVFLCCPSLPAGYGQQGALSEQERELIPAEDYFYFPANLWPHKNHRRVLAAFERLLKRTGRAARLVLTGHPDGWATLREEFPTLPVTHLGFVREPMVQALMAGSRALAFFSLHEGFGIPLLEAFHARTPVICSNTTSLPEVGGDAVLGCDPTDVDAISGLMERILVDGPLRADLIERGAARSAHYTWESAADGLVQACEFVGRPQSAPDIRILPAPPLVTIVTPSYNQGQFLRATIESVLTQSYPHIQYLVIDGGSKDESVEILKSYGDRFFWKSEKDGGQADAINQGMAMAKGEIQAYLNSDDVIMPGAIQRVVDHFQANPECDMVYGRAHYIDKQGNVTGFYRTDDYTFGRLMHDCCVCQPAAFWQARIARVVGPIDASLHLALDFDYWLRIDRAGGRIQHIHDVLAESRLYPDTKTLSMRGTSYSETFAICMKHGGYVDYNYFQGLWHHRVNERHDGWPRFFKAAPGSFLPMAWVHHKIFEARRTGGKHATRHLLNQALGSAFRVPVAGPALARGLHKLRPTLAPPRMYGLMSDNWMAPEAQIIVRPKAAGQRLRHVGYAPVDMTVTLSEAGTVLGEYSLKAGKIQAIGEDISVNGDRPLTLEFRFSGFVPDGADRRLSFLVVETNLFSEDDLG